MYPQLTHNDAVPISAAWQRYGLCQLLPSYYWDFFVVVAGR